MIRSMSLAEQLRLDSNSAALTRHENECAQADRDMETFGDEARQILADRMFKLPKNGIEMLGRFNVDALLDSFLNESLADWLPDWQRFRKAVSAEDATEIGACVLKALRRCAESCAEKSSDELGRIMAELAEES